MLRKILTRKYTNRSSLVCAPQNTNKVVIIGLGAVGSATAFALLIEGITSEIVLIDANVDKSKGEALDLEHGISFVNETQVRAGSYEECRDAQVVVICAGIAQKPGQTRLELTETNSKIITEITHNITKYTKNAIILMVTNPVDVLTYVALKKSGLPDKQVFGSGTILDSSRFRYHIAREFGVATESVGAYIIGEHGESQVPVYSHCNILGEPIVPFLSEPIRDLEKAFDKTKNAASEIINLKGYTSYAIALATVRLIRAILYDENHIFPVSVYLDSLYGVNDVCLSVPAVVGKSGIKKIIDIKLTEDELAKFHHSADVIKSTIKSIS